MTPFPYGHGYVNGMKWRDIMSYKESCGGCPRLPVWSSPNVFVRGDPAGTPNEDNARVIAEQAARVANFRASRRSRLLTKADTKYRTSSPQEIESLQVVLAEAVSCLCCSG
jgi:hypothetical protein